MVDNSELLHKILKNNIKNYSNIQQKDQKLSEDDIQKRKLLEESEISLIINSYDDIFSDFDPRPYTQRSLSVDMLDELKRASRDKASGQTELKFLIPKDLRKESDEIQIKKRLREHFKRHTDGSYE